jgi:hypothetical protein
MHANGLQSDADVDASPERQRVPMLPGLAVVPKDVMALCTAADDDQDNHAIGPC